MISQQAINVLKNKKNIKNSIEFINVFINICGQTKSNWIQIHILIKC